MKVFISYGDAADQVTALRLQALGAVNGLTVYVPPAYTRHTPTSLDPEASREHKRGLLFSILQCFRTLAG